MARKAADEAAINEVEMDEQEAMVPDKGEPALAEDPWKEKRTIFLPKAPKGEDNFLIASVNGRVFKIRRGEQIEVPLPIAQVIENSFKDADKADEFMEKKIFE